MLNKGEIRDFLVKCYRTKKVRVDKYLKCMFIVRIYNNKRKVNQILKKK